MTGFRAAAFALFATLAVSGAGAQSQPADPAAFQAAVDEARARLKLTPQQEAQLKPLLQERNQDLKAIRDKYAGDDSRRARREMFKEAEPVVENYHARVRTILDEAQYAEWEKMRDEARERLKAAHKRKRGVPE